VKEVHWYRSAVLVVFFFNLKRDGLVQVLAEQAWALQQHEPSVALVCRSLIIAAALWPWVGHR